MTRLLALALLLALAVPAAAQEVTINNNVNVTTYRHSYHHRPDPNWYGTFPVRRPSRAEMREELCRIENAQRGGDFFSSLRAVELRCALRFRR
jgi:hypothetical protein